jgi:hypothetical protein
MYREYFYNYIHDIGKLPQVAENIKEFFHNEGIHSTTIQPEFMDYGRLGEDLTVVHDDCVLACPKGPAKDNSTCEANKCCPLPNGKSTHNTPVVERRSSSFVLDKTVRNILRLT